jgi:hypothetical protein
MRASDPTPYRAFLANIPFDATAAEVEAALRQQIGGVRKVFLPANRESPDIVELGSRSSTTKIIRRSRLRTVGPSGYAAGRS